MITCNIIGGLGNQLFQIFATISYALKHKQVFINLLLKRGLKNSLFQEFHFSLLS